MTSNPQPSTFNLRPKAAWFLAFAAVFAALAGYVFWGTWSLDVIPVMPDCRTTYPATISAYVSEWIRGWFASGKFAPDDIKVFLGSPWFWQELQYALAAFFAALGLVYYCRGRGLSHLASYGAGILLAFCGYWFSLFSAGHLGWFRWMTYGVFAFGLADRAVRRNKLKNWLLLGACVAWGSFYQPDLWLLFTIFTALYFVWCCVRERKLPWKGSLIALAAFLVIGAPGIKGAAADKESREKQIEKGETVAPGAAKDDAEKRWIFVTNWSLPADETAEFFIPRLNGDTSCPLTLSIGAAKGTGVKPYTGALGRPIDAKQGNYRQHSLYVGWITCLLALLGGVFGLVGLRGAGRGCAPAEQSNNRLIEKSKNSSDVPFFLFAAILFYLLSLGRNCEPLYRLVFALPIGDSIRCPVKWHHLTEFSLCILAAYGIDGLLAFLKKLKLPSLITRHSSLITILILLFAAFDLARNDRIFCAPVDIRQAQRMNCDAQMNILRRQDFSNPQVAEMVKRGYIVSLANYLGHPDYYLVEMLTPRKPSKTKPLPPMTTATWLGVLSLCGTVFVSAFAVRSALRKESK